MLLILQEPSPSPVSFTQQSHSIYEIMQKMQLKCIAMLREYRRHKGVWHIK